jgi:hypothetical protein
VFAAALFAGAALTGTAPHAGAQYPPPPINAECHILQVVGAPTTTQGGRIVVPFQGTIQVAAAPECAQSGEEVEIWAQSHLIRIHDGFNAAADGSYTSPPIQLPAHLAPGPHQIRPRHLQSNVEYFCPILVVDAATDTATAPLAAGGGGALRPASSNGGGGGGGGGGGLLPKTGVNIVTLVLFALGLIGAGTMMRRAASRRRRRRRQSRRRSEVPRLDTLVVPDRGSVGPA